MTALIRKIHIYAGLLVFAQLVIYGIAGLAATIYAGPERPKIPYLTRYVPFTVPPSSTDQQVAALAYRTLHFPLARPIPGWFLRRTAANHLLLDFYTINGIHRVVVLEQEHRLRVEEIRNNTALFLGDVHAATPGDQDAPPLIRAWAWWNEAGMWTLLGFCLSGLWLWLSTRPRYRWAWVSITAGAASLAVFWSAFR